MGDAGTAIELRAVTKTFGTVVANNRIDFSVADGEILALLGENGSGKTTLMNMVAGIYYPDSGQIFVRGQAVSIKSPQAAGKLGIGMIHQHFQLVEVHTAAENILLGVQEKAGMEKMQALCTRFGLELDLHKRIYTMSVSEKQTVEILKVLYRGARILVLDEPTAVLTPQETQRLFVILRRMKEDGCAVVIITHKLHEVLEISDRVTILRKGESVETVRTAETTAAQLTELMVGRPVELAIARPPVRDGGTLLEIVHLTVTGEQGADVLHDVSFDLRRGEILGVAGVAGSGQKELCEAIAGLQKVREGAILYQKENLVGKTPREIIKKGISMSFIPEDRLGMGLAASMGMVDNMLLKSYQAGHGPFVRRKPARDLAVRLVEQFQIVTPNVDTPVRRLSGGNVQKVLLGREIESGPQMLITAYAVRGLDIHSSYTIYDALNAQKEKGVGIVFVGEDLDVMLELCDRILVLCHGQVTGIVDAAAVTKEALGLLMTGVTAETEGQHEHA